MKYFLDTEFIEAGRRNPITLISIGIVSEDGRKFYEVSSDFDADDANDWVKKNVLPHLGDRERVSCSEIRARLIDFIGDDAPEFWGYYADYDWVVTAQLFGAMVNLPKNWPMFCRDIKQFAMELGNPRLPKQSGREHNALADAEWNKLAYEFLIEKAKTLALTKRDSGVGRIVLERVRQVQEEGWTPEHDAQHDKGQLVAAALCYSSYAAHQVGIEFNEKIKRELYTSKLKPLWPWADEWWKPSDDPIRNLEKAGALIAAEIDRLTRKK